MEIFLAVIQSQQSFYYCVPCLNVYQLLENIQANIGWKTWYMYMKWKKKA